MDKEGNNYTNDHSTASFHKRSFQIFRFGSLPYTKHPPTPPPNTHTYTLSHTHTHTHTHHLLILKSVHDLHRLFCHALSFGASDYLLINKGYSFNQFLWENINNFWKKFCLKRIFWKGHIVEYLTFPK